MMRSGTTIQVFARSPRRGYVKTRLQATHGSYIALRVYRGLLQHTLSQIAPLQMSRQLWVDGGCAHPLIHEARHYFDLHRQCGTDLGKRMQTAMRHALMNSRQVILIGTDCASLTGNIVLQAQACLSQHADLVLGPAADGGYYLIGLKRPIPALFMGIEWGGADVLVQTLQRAARFGLRVDLLPVLNDIDNADDLLDVPKLMELPFKGL